MGHAGSGVPLGVEQRGHFGFLDALRGLAAMWVVLNHLEVQMPNLFPELPSRIQGWVIQNGGQGVQVFFVLSGFVIVYSLRSVQMRARETGNFLVRRFVRLSPPYYAALALALLVTGVSATVKDEVWSFPEPVRILAHLLYVPDLFHMEMINGVHWTLYIEMQFYVLLALTLMVATRSERLFRPVIGACLVIALASPLFDLRDGRENFFFAYWHSFMFGALVFWALTGRMPRWTLWAYLGVEVLAWVLHRDGLVGATIVTAVLIVLAQDHGRMHRWLHQRPFQFLGRISYSLYLVHAPVLGAVFYLVTKIVGQDAVGEALAIVPAIAASVVVATVWYWAFERRAIEWSRQLRLAPRPRAVPAESGSS